MGAGKVSREAHRDDRPDPHLTDDIGDREDRGIDQHLAKRRIGQRGRIVLKAEERPRQCIDVAERHLLQAHQEIVGDRESDQSEQIAGRNQQEDVEQEGAVAHHKILPSTLGLPAHSKCVVWSGSAAGTPLPPVGGEGRLLSRSERNRGGGTTLAPSLPHYPPPRPAFAALWRVGPPPPLPGGGWGGCPVSARTPSPRWRGSRRGASPPPPPP